MEWVFFISMGMVLICLTFTIVTGKRMLEYYRKHGKDHPVMKFMLVLCAISVIAFLVSFTIMDIRNGGVFH